MLDRTIPFQNVILKCRNYSQKEYTLPEGFQIVPYHEGFEEAWAKLEYNIGDFSSIEEAKEYFISTYLWDKSLQSHLLFLMNPEQCVIGSCIAWTDTREHQQVSSLHWLVIDDTYQGLGLGKALCLATMNLFKKQNKFPVYIHTQPWSWKGILLYISIGFKIQKSDTFSHYENQYYLAMETLHGIVDENQYQIMESSSEE